MFGLGGVGGVGGEWLTGLGLVFTNSGGTWGKWDMCVFWGRVGVLGQGLGGSVCVVSLEF